MDGTRNGENQRGMTVRQITELVRRAISGHREVYAAVLMGSCSRGEECYCQAEDGELQLLSDYEFTVVTKGRGFPKAVDTALKKLNEELKAKLQSPFFRLEWNYVWKYKLPFMDKRFIHFEMAEARFLICGNEKVFDLLPRINVKNLNYAELDSIINHRVYHVLRDYSRVSEHRKKYLIARNTLDILSVVLPYEGELICSYKKRIERLPALVTDRYFTGDLKSRLHCCLDMKMDDSSPFYEMTSADAMLSLFILDMDSLHEYMRDRQGGRAFQTDRRRVLKALSRFRFAEVKDVLERPEREEALYTDMMDEMRERIRDPDDFSPRVYELYGCK